MMIAVARRWPYPTNLICSSPDAWIPEADLRRPVECLQLRLCMQLGQRLAFDLPDSLARHVERVRELVERRRILAVQSVATFEDPALPARERREHPAQRLLAPVQLENVLREDLVLVSE